MKAPISTYAAEHAPKAVAVDQALFLKRWLYLVAALLLVAVVLGVVTRLDHAGPPLGTFIPISRLLPPATARGWQALFDRFRQSPGFGVNEEAGMTLARFRFLYLWEWARVLAGYAINVVLALGFVAVLARKERRSGIGAELLVLAVMGLAQASLGSLLGSAGLLRRGDLTQFAVAANVASASALFVWCVWLAANVKRARLSPAVPGLWMWAVGGLAALVFTQMILGAFVAGLRAGTVFSTWPLMGGALIPDGLWFFSPWWKNLVDNALSVEFWHRVLGYVIFLYAAALLVVSYLRNFERYGLERPAARIFALVLVQACLGVGTVLTAAAIPLAAAHAAAALLLMGLLTTHVADVVKVARLANSPGEGSQR